MLPAHELFVHVVPLRAPIAAAAAAAFFARYYSPCW